MVFKLHKYLGLANTRQKTESILDTEVQIIKTPSTTNEMKGNL